MGVGRTFDNFIRREKVDVKTHSGLKVMHEIGFTVSCSNLRLRLCLGLQKIMISL